jgi:hypothetical protein
MAKIIGSIGLAFTPLVVYASYEADSFWLFCVAAWVALASILLAFTKETK